VTAGVTGATGTAGGWLGATVTTAGGGASVVPALGDAVTTTAASQHVDSSTDEQGVIKHGMLAAVDLSTLPIAHE